MKRGMKSHKGRMGKKGGEWGEKHFSTHTKRLDLEHACNAHLATGVGLAGGETIPLITY